MRALTECRIEDLTGDRDEVRMRYPCSVGTVAGLPPLVLPDGCQGALRDVGLAAIRDEGAHAADGVRPASVAGGDQQLLVGAHERDSHGDLCPVR